MLRTFFEPFISYKYLLFQLTQREVKARYKQSFVGYAWVLVNPLAQLFVYSFVFSLVFRFPTDNIPYPVFLFATLLPWTFFQTGLMSATVSLVENGSLLKKVKFPREIIPYSAILAKIIDFIFSSLVFLLFVIMYQVPLSASIIWFPVLFGTQILFMTGISFFMSALNLFYRDIQYLTNLLLMLWMYMTPIVYPLSMVPEKYLALYKLNPMVGIMEGYRSAIFGYPFEWGIIGWSMLVSVIFSVTGYFFFKRIEKTFADAV